MENTSNSTDASLLIRVQDPNNHDAWSEFDAMYRPMITRFCIKKFSMKPDAADESAQEVLVKLVSHMRAFRYDPSRSFRSWLSTVARNSVIDGLRKKRVDKAAGGSAHVNILNNLPTREDDVEDELTEKLTTELQQTLFTECEEFVKSRVTDQTWNAFTMLRVGKKAAEVGEVLGMTVAAVYRSKTRVLRLFREEVAMKLQAAE